MYAPLRRILFAPAPETAHDFALNALAGASRSRALCALIGGRNRAALPTEVMGIAFPNPVGLAAGLDKHAAAANALSALGFGWLELGTVTPLPQPGNPRPRLFRLSEHGALINRMGFNSVGLDRFLHNLRRCRPGIIKGINLGRNAATAAAADDYLAGLAAVHEHADYIAINISSPNTPGLRDLQHEDALAPLLAALNRRRMELADAHGRRTPLALKIAPDLSHDALDAIAELARKHAIDAIAATNTTSARPGVEAHPRAAESGGLSGAPLAPLSTAAIAALFRNLQGEIPLIGIGGINSAAAAMEKFHAGADLVQLYTGFIYEGPKLIRDIITRLKSEMAEGQTPADYLAQLRGA